jgi:hypothetical protein
VLSVEDWAEIRRLHRAERLPIRQIARVVGVSRNAGGRRCAALGPRTQYVAGEIAQFDLWFPPHRGGAVAGLDRDIIRFADRP